MRQQKLTPVASSLLVERQIVNGCSGFSGRKKLDRADRRKLTVFPPITQTLRELHREISTPGTRGGVRKMSGQAGMIGRNRAA